MAERQGKGEPAPQRKRALVSCDRCKLRRARCIRENPDEPCADCKMSGVQCESKLPRKQRVYGSVETLSLRYRALEALVKGLFPQENTQETNAIFKLAAQRNIPMPASDDFTPADIFNDPQKRPPSFVPTPLPQRQLSSQPIHQPFSPTQSTSESSRSTEAPSFPSSRRDDQSNPFSAVQQSSYDKEELIPTRHGVPHYFGPSSCFRFATTIRTLVARCKAVPGADGPLFRASSQPYVAGRSTVSLPHSISNPSDEEYTVPGSKEALSTDHRARKRSRTQMEEHASKWGRPAEFPEPDTLADLLPSRSLADALVTAYFDKPHCYNPLFHRSMFQFRLEATYARKAERLVDCTDRGWLTSLALVFAFGCQQLHEHDPEEAEKLRLRYLDFAKSNFRQLLTTTSLTNVQALVLLQLHHHTVGQVSTSWLMMGLAARMAITMGMHRDGANMEFDPIERNTRRQVWWTIYTYEKILCSILGRPSVVDDKETFFQTPDATMLEQKNMPAEFMHFGFEIVRLWSYNIRQRAYFDRITTKERTPTLALAGTLLQEFDDFWATLPPNLSLDFAPVPIDQKGRILLLHIYYLHSRSIVLRDFLIQTVERRIAQLENHKPVAADSWPKTMSLSEDCVETAHQGIRCILATAQAGLIGYCWLDLFYVIHPVLIVCADFLARPKDQRDSPKDAERKETVRAMLDYVRGMKKLAPTYKILSQIAIQFASITNVIDTLAIVDRDSSGSTAASEEAEPAMGWKGVSQTLVEISDMQENWFTNEQSALGLDFFDLLNTPISAAPPPDPGNATAYLLDPNQNEPADWATRSVVRNMPPM